MASNDPFFASKELIERQLSDVQELHTKWEMLLRTENTETSAAFKKAHKGLQKKLNDATTIADSMAGAISMIKANRQKFAHITDKDLDGRQRFVAESNRTIAKFSAELRSPQTLGKIDSDRKAVLGSAIGSGKVRNAYRRGLLTRPSDRPPQRIPNLVRATYARIGRCQS
jgi:hypothetical protein